MMVSQLRIVIFSVVVSCVLCQTSVFTRYLLEDEAKATGAVCLDGTPPAYYYRPGYGSGVNKWYLHHEGGGYCFSLSNCYSRSKTSLGSSKSYPPTGQLNNDYFSQSPTLNPLFYNWNSVYMKYCDGSFYSSDNEKVSEYNGEPIYYRGNRIIAAFNNDLMTNRGLNNATDVVVSGCSAGGIATYTRVDWWKAHMNSKTRVVGMPDSGYVLDYNSNSTAHFHSDVMWIFDNMNTTSGLNQDCVDAYTQSNEGVWHCSFAEYTAPFIRTPIFPLQSEFDAWQIPYDLGTNNTELVNQWGARLVSLVDKTILSKTQNSIFLDSCYHHCGGWNSIKINGVTQAQAFKMWYEGDNTRWFQDKPYPCGTCCN